MFRPRILLVRHGETDDNKNRIFQGQKGSGLNSGGKEQAAKLAARLTGTAVAAFFASDLQRARETAEILAAPHVLPVTTRVDLREVDVGEWSGVGYDEVAARFPEEYAAWQAGLDVRRGGGETYDELAGRMMGALAAVCAQSTGVVVCVSHGGAIRSVIRSLLGAGSHPRALAAADNTGVTVLERSEKEQTFRVAVYNDTNHLEDAVTARVPRRE